MTSNTLAAEGRRLLREAEETSTGDLEVWVATNLDYLLSALEERERLRTDPAVVHMAMLRGDIAKPAIRELLHVHGADALARWDEAGRVRSLLKEAGEELEDLGDMAEEWDDPEENFPDSMAVWPTLSIGLFRKARDLSTRIIALLRAEESDGQ